MPWVLFQNNNNWESELNIEGRLNNIICTSFISRSMLESVLFPVTFHNNGFVLGFRFTTQWFITVGTVVFYLYR